MNDTNHQRATDREHVQAVIKPDPIFRGYDFNDGTWDGLAALTSCWRLERDIPFTRADLKPFLTDLGKHVPELMQQKLSADAFPATFTQWKDDCTSQPALNPWFGDPSQQDIASQVAITKCDPVLAAHLQRLAKDGGVTYKYLVELKEAEAKRQRRASFVYNSKTHADNPFRDPKKLAEQSQMMTDDPELAEYYREEAKNSPVRLPWQVGFKNMTLLAKISADNPSLGRLMRKAETLLEQWTKDDLAVARAAEEQARRVRVEAEMRLAPPPKLQ